MIPSESHRESWDNILLLMLTKLLKLDSNKVIYLFYRKAKGRVGYKIKTKSKVKFSVI